MYHIVARSLPGTLLFRTWGEGLACWNAITRAIPNLVAFVVMPNHVHLLHESAVEGRLSAALSGYIRSRNHHRGEADPGIEPVPPAQRLSTDDKIRRNIRYLHLNPCRWHLVDDPLAWPLSTHRDAVGLMVRPVISRRPDPDRFHSYVSSDPSVSVEGTCLPFASRGTATAAEIVAAVSALTRAPPSMFARRGWIRRFYLESARGLTLDDNRTIGAPAACSRWSVQRRKKTVNADVRLVERVAGDPRFPALIPGDLRPTWPFWLQRFT